MYSTARTPARPPKISAAPALAESRLNGQTPTSALICRRSKVPSSGSAANIVEGLQTRFEPVNGRLDIRPHSGMGAGQAILLGGQHLDQLAPPLEQRRQRLGLLVLPWAGRRLDRVAKAGQHQGIQGVGLGQTSQGFGEIPRLAGLIPPSAGAPQPARPPPASPNPGRSRTIRRGAGCNQPVSSAKPASSRNTRNRSWAGQVATSRWALATSIPTQHAPSSGGWTASAAGFLRGRGSSATATGAIAIPTRPRG